MLLAILTNFTTMLSYYIWGPICLKSTDFDFKRRLKNVLEKAIFRLLFVLSWAEVLSICCIGR